MKKLLLLLFVLLQHGFRPSKALAQDDIYVSYQEFYDNLSPYGQWVNDSEYGYVWVPNEDDDFRPYFTGGHWAMTEYGNTWVSDYPWGWACFHYGRWIYNGYYGWVWIPGYEWGPGWVAWRWGDGYCGWAPLYPGIVWAGYGYGCPNDWWIFMHPRYLYRPRYHNVWRTDFIRGPRRTSELINRTTYVSQPHQTGSQNYYSGPHAAQVQQVTRQPVQVYQVGAGNVRGADRISNNVVSIYRPAQVQRLPAGSTRPAPATVMPAPQPVNRRGDVHTNWNQPRQFRQDIQQQNPSWNRPFMRNAPPYNTQPNTPRQQSNPVRPANPPRQINTNPTRQQSNPAPVRQPRVAPANNRGAQPQRAGGRR